MLINNPFHNAFGLDIGDRDIKAIQLVHGWSGLSRSGYRVKFKARFGLPPGAIVGGEIREPEAVINSLKTHLFNKNRPHLKSPWVVACLPETKTFVRVITLKIPFDEFRKELIPEVAPSYLPFALEEVYLDWQLLTQNKKASEIEVLIGAVPKTIADSYTYLLNIAGMTPLALEIEALALARCLISHASPPKDEAVAILDLGATRAGFALYDRGAVQFSLTLPFSGIQIDEKIAEAFQITLPEAEMIKIGLIKPKAADQAKMRQLIDPEIEELAKEVKEAIKFYKARFPRGSRVHSIMLCGGLANLPDLEKILSLKLRVKSRRADPTINFRTSKALPPFLSDSSLATAVGLAMRALEKPFNNLHPPHYA